MNKNSTQRPAYCACARFGQAISKFSVCRSFRGKLSKLWIVYLCFCDFAVINSLIYAKMADTAEVNTVETHADGWDCSFRCFSGACVGVAGRFVRASLHVVPPPYWKRVAGALCAKMRSRGMHFFGFSTILNVNWCPNVFMLQIISSANEIWPI